MLCYSDPTKDTEFLFNYLETRKISEGKIYQLHKVIHFAIQLLFDMFITEINIYTFKAHKYAQNHMQVFVLSLHYF